MRKPELNFLIDSLAFFFFLCLLSTGLLIYFIMPPASGLSVWDMDRHGWGDIHFWIAISFLVLMAIHFILHWSWIKARIKGSSKDIRTSRKRGIVAIVLVIFLLILLLAPFLSPVENTGDRHGRHSGLIEMQQ